MLASRNIKSLPDADVAEGGLVDFARPALGEAAPGGIRTCHTGIAFRF
jgi:hypothetical protein